MRRILTAVVGLAVLAGARADDQGTVTELDGLKSKVPSAWKAQEIKTRERVYHFVIAKEKDDKHDAEMLVFFFGPGGGGGVKANLERWKKMIEPADGKKIDDVSKTEELTIGAVKATVLDATGTYTYKMRPFDPNEKGEKRENYRLIGVVFESPNGPYFIRFIGPAKTVEANKKAFDHWLKNFK